MTSPTPAPPLASPSSSPTIEMPNLGHVPDDYADGPSSTALFGKTFEYTYTKGNHYRLIFDDAQGVSFQMIGDGSEPRGPLPYRCRELRPNQYLVHWLVREFHIHVSLVVDLDEDAISVAAVMPPGGWEFFDHAAGLVITPTTA